MALKQQLMRPRKHTELDLQSKLELIKEAEANPKLTQAQLASIYGIGKSTVGDILRQQRQKLLQLDDYTCDLTRKRFKCVDDLASTSDNWCPATCSTNTTIVSPTANIDADSMDSLRAAGLGLRLDSLTDPSDCFQLSSSSDNSDSDGTSGVVQQVNRNTKKNSHKSTANVKQWIGLETMTKHLDSRLNSELSSKEQYIHFPLELGIPLQDKCRNKNLSAKVRESFKSRSTPKGASVIVKSLSVGVDSGMVITNVTQQGAAEPRSPAQCDDLDSSPTLLHSYMAKFYELTMHGSELDVVGGATSKGREGRGKQRPSDGSVHLFFSDSDSSDHDNESDSQSVADYVGGADMTLSDAHVMTRKLYNFMLTTLPAGLPHVQQCRKLLETAIDERSFGRQMTILDFFRPV